MDDLYKLVYDDKITVHQCYRLRELRNEGYDISVALEGKINGFQRCNEMARRIRNGDEEGVRELIRQTAEEEAEEQRIIEEHLRAQAGRNV